MPLVLNYVSSSRTILIDVASSDLQFSYLFILLFHLVLLIKRIAIKKILIEGLNEGWDVSTTFHLGVQLVINAICFTFYVSEGYSVVYNYVFTVCSYLCILMKNFVLQLLQRFFVKNDMIKIKRQLSAFS